MPWESEGVDVRAFEGSNAQGAFPSQPEDVHLHRIKERLGPKQHLVAHLQDGVDPAPGPDHFLLACLLRCEEQSPAREFQ